MLIEETTTVTTLICDECGKTIELGINLAFADKFKMIRSNKFVFINDHGTRKYFCNICKKTDKIESYLKNLRLQPVTLIDMGKNFSLEYLPEMLKDKN